MSTVAPPRPPAPPVHPALVDSEQFIDDHIRRTQRGLKLVDLAAGLLTLAVGLLAFLLAAAVIDHWIVPGGLGPWGRGAMFGLLVLGLAWYAWRQFVPLVRAINPVYAAHTIEQTAPSLKNSLLNVLLFRAHRQGMSAKVFYALEQQAAHRLSSAQAEAVIDRTGLLRLGYALVAVLAAAALYAVLSPKDMAASVGRVVAPWANIAAPSRVRVLEVEPGDASVARGERVPISATIVGADEDDAVRIRYSTLDESQVGESIAMNRPTGAARYSADLPRGGDAAGVDGVQKDLEYWIEAGDGRSPKYKLTVYTRPTIVVQRVRYKPPAYTGDLPKVVENVGDLFGLEGTEVTIEALANHPIQTANVDFDADGTIDEKMAVDDNRATVTFTLALREDRRTPWHNAYVLRYTTTTGRANEDPVQHRIDVTPDYLPEVSIAKPEEAELAVRANDVVSITVEARDPDFALQNVGLRGEVRGGEALHVDLLNNRHAGLFRQEHRLTPADLQLKPGDVLEYWAVARDNREPPGAEVASEHRRLRIVDPNDPRAPRNPGGQGGDDQNQGDGDNQSDQQGGDGGAEGGQAGGGSSGQAGEGENDSGEGAAGGGAGEGEPQQGENAQGEGGEGGGDSSQQQPGSEGEGGANSGGGASEGGQRDGSQENSANQGGEQNPGESGNSGGDGNDEASAGDSASGEADGGGQEQESVSSAGEEDAEAFDRIRRRMAERQAAEQGGQNAGGDAEAGGEDAESGTEGGEQAAGDDSESPSEGGDSASGDAADSESSTGEAGEGSNDGGAADSGTSRTGNRNQQAGESAGANTESDSESENGESPDSANETPAGADGGANPTSGESPTGDDTSGEGGAPEASHKGPRDQAAGDEPSQPGMEGETPTDDTKGRTESDARGDQSGDRAGEGQKGGGQQAENAGEGEAGSHSPTDTGANQSSDPGAGATGTEAGDEQLADGETGESSGDQAGDGSESGEAEGESSQNPGGDQSGAGSQSQGGSSESANESGSEGSESGSDAGGEAGESGESGQSATSGQQPGSQGESESSGDNSSEQGDSSQGDSSGGSAAPPTGGGTSGGGVDGPGGASEPGGDDANLAYAREQTDLVLESLEDQLAKGQVDDELLEDLGWSQDDLRNFVDRWKGLFDAAEREGEASDAQERLDAALRSLGPGARGNLQLQGSAPADELRDLNDSYRARAPLEYADRVRAYLRGASAAEESDD